MATGIPTWDDLSREILGLKGAILGAKAAWLHGSKINFQVLNQFKEIADRLATMVEDIRIREVSNCLWQYVDYDEYWDTDCGNTFCFTDGGPKENQMKFCPYCGRKLKVKK